MVSLSKLVVKTFGFELLTSMTQIDFDMVTAIGLELVFLYQTTHLWNTVFLYNLWFLGRTLCNAAPAPVNVRQAYHIL
jgi:hypothetical protein